jgi:predicted ATPase/DNA-binding winged helix-turn-helix (wHTH) protein
MVQRPQFIPTRDLTDPPSKTAPKIAREMSRSLPCSDRGGECDEFRFGPFHLIASERLLMRGTEAVALGGRAFDVLIALIERAGEVVGHRELFKRVWPDVIVEESSLRVHIAGLRRALGDGRDGARYIANAPGRGYCFVAAVQRPERSGLFRNASEEHTIISALPSRLQRMVGRDETVEALRSEVKSRQFVSIVGPGGVGKTTVAVAVAHRMATDFEDAICFVDLGAIRDSALVVPAVASAVGCLEQTRDSLPRLVDFLADKRILLVLDGCEHVVQSVAMLTELLVREAPLMHILATSREALRVEGENIRLLQPLDCPPDEFGLTAAKAMASPAVQLFMDRAAAGGYRDALTDQAAPVVAEICSRLDGMPLAIELTASRTSIYGISGLAQLIGDRLMLLWQGRRNVPRHQTLQAMLDWSYDLLSEREKEILCTVSVFVGTFTLEMAQAIEFEQGRDGLQVWDVIASLVDKSLITVSQTEDASSYRLLDTTRAYAAVKLLRRGEENAIARRHALHYSEQFSGIQNQHLAKARSIRLLAARWRHQHGTRTERFDVRRHFGWCDIAPLSSAAVPSTLDAERVLALVPAEETGVG